MTAKKLRKPGRAERTERSQAIHTNLDQAASLINSVHASVLADVIEARVSNLHRATDGSSGLRDWLMERFDFHMRVAADLAVIARLSGKFTALAQAATSGAARIDGVAAAVRRLEKTRALRVRCPKLFGRLLADNFLGRCGTIGRDYRIPGLRPVVDNRRRSAAVECCTTIQCSA